MLQPFHILITGGAGYVGSVMVNKALDDGFKVNVLDIEDKNTCCLKELIAEQKINYIQGDISNQQLIEESLKNVNAVIHLAGVSDGRAGKANPELTKTVNVDAFEKLLMTSKHAGVQKFLFASTMGVYGNSYHIPLTENLTLKPIDPYSESKANGEALLSKHHSSNFSTTALRLAMVYGVSPAMRFDFIVNRLTLDALQNKKITMIGGAQKRPQVYINDVAHIFLELAQSTKKNAATAIYNVVGCNPTVAEMAKVIQSQITDVFVENLPARDNEDSFEMNGSKLKNESVFQLQDTIVYGVKKIIKQYATTNY